MTIWWRRSGHGWRLSERGPSITLKRQHPFRSRSTLSRNCGVLRGLTELALPRVRNKGHAARAGARRIYASAIAATRALWAIELGCDDKTLFRLDVWITTGAAGRWDHRRLARVRRWRFHFPINVGRADYPMSLAELFAQRLIAALLLGACF
jgi:hypothetical protein